MILICLNIQLPGDFRRAWLLFKPINISYFHNKY